MSWSGGKDSAMALERARATKDVEVVALLTTCNGDYDRVSIHGVRREILEAQARAAGLPLTTLAIPSGCTHQQYERRMGSVLAAFKQQGVSHVIHGDLFLADLRAYREKKLAQVGLRGYFPLWGENTARLARWFVDRGYGAVVVCVDTDQLDASFSGRKFDHEFLDALPAGVDPCGENGEFHTFVHRGPVLKEEVPITIGEGALREGRFQFTDLLLARYPCPPQA
jgi:uncharacterized protein (TIGR00290 family)